MATAMSAYILIVDLGDEDHSPTVLRAFDNHRSLNGVGRRLTKTLVSDNGADVTTSARILRLTVSVDGQWLASSDDHSRTHVFNLDSVQVRS